MHTLERSHVTLTKVLLPSTITFPPTHGMSHTSLYSIWHDLNKIIVEVAPWAIGYKHIWWDPQAPLGEVTCDLDQSTSSINNHFPPTHGVSHASIYSIWHDLNKMVVEVAPWAMFYKHIWWDTHAPFWEVTCDFDKSTSSITNHFPPHPWSVSY